MRIEADNSEARAAYITLADVVRRHGGWLHPGLVVHQCGGALWASMADEAEPDAPLIRLPAPLLIPLAGLTWDDEGELSLRDDAGLLSPLQREVLDAMLCLYRVTGKLAWSRGHLPLLALPAEDPLRQSLARWRPQFHSPQGVAETFLRSRSLGVRTGETRQPVIFPIGDVLNHHPEGAPLNVKANIGLNIRRGGPAGDSQCYADYGFKDALDLALAYGYADSGVRFVRSLPITVEVPSLGPLEIRGSGPRGKHDLPSVEHGPGHLRLTHLNFHCDKPGRSLSLIRIIVGGLPSTRSQAERESLAAKAHEALVAANLEAWQQLQREARRLLDEGSGSPAHRLLAEVAEQQQHRLRLATTTC